MLGEDEVREGERDRRPATSRYTSLPLLTLRALRANV
jgi:hypothetical protein